MVGKNYLARSVLNTAGDIVNNVVIAIYYAIGINIGVTLCKALYVII